MSDLVTPWVKAREGELYDGNVKRVVAAIKSMAEHVGVAPEGNPSPANARAERAVGCFLGA
jgi:hypothetical protein